MFRRLSSLATSLSEIIAPPIVLKEDKSVDYAAQVKGYWDSIASWYEDMGFGWILKGLEGYDPPPTLEVTSSTKIPSCLSGINKVLKTEQEFLITSTLLSVASLNPPSNTGSADSLTLAATSANQGSSRTSLHQDENKVGDAIQVGATSDRNGEIKGRQELLEQTTDDSEVEFGPGLTWILQTNLLKKLFNLARKNIPIGMTNEVVLFLTLLLSNLGNRSERLLMQTNFRMPLLSLIEESHQHLIHRKSRLLEAENQFNNSPQSSRDEYFRKESTRIKQLELSLLSLVNTILRTIKSRPSLIDLFLPKPMDADESKSLQLSKFPLLYLIIDYCSSYGKVGRIARECVLLVTQIPVDHVFITLTKLEFGRIISDQFHHLCTEVLELSKRTDDDLLKTVNDTHSPTSSPPFTPPRLQSPLQSKQSLLSSFPDTNSPIPSSVSYPRHPSLQDAIIYYQFIDALFSAISCSSVLEKSVSIDLSNQLLLFIIRYCWKKLVAMVVTTSHGSVPLARAGTKLITELVNLTTSPMLLNSLVVELFGILSNKDSQTLTGLEVLLRRGFTVPENVANARGTENDDEQLSEMISSLLLLESLLCSGNQLAYWYLIRRYLIDQSGPTDIKVKDVRLEQAQFCQFTQNGEDVVDDADDEDDDDDDIDWVYELIDRVLLYGRVQSHPNTHSNTVKAVHVVQSIPTSNSSPTTSLPTDSSLTNDRRQMPDHDALHSLSSAYDDYFTDAQQKCQESCTATRTWFPWSLFPTILFSAPPFKELYPSAASTSTSFSSPQLSSDNFISLLTKTTKLWFQNSPELNICLTGLWSTVCSLNVEELDELLFINGKGMKEERDEHGGLLTDMLGEISTKLNELIDHNPSIIPSVSTPEFTVPSSSQNSTTNHVEQNGSSISNRIAYSTT
ncbi:hypothetical protein BKA69DRAFT_1121814 [Paraphysoderma sedebokerense]|nr:hypothetical protein BKA69DRAFT_1121814 [Paraphysoderma sedebokerense]